MKDSRDYEWVLFDELLAILTNAEPTGLTMPQLVRAFVDEYGVRYKASTLVWSVSVLRRRGHVITNTGRKPFRCGRYRVIALAPRNQHPLPDDAEVTPIP